MQRGIFVIGKSGELINLENQEYESEDLLQQLLASYPSLLVNPGEDAKSLLLIKREMAVFDDESKSRWSLDHLFLDYDGVPTLVEVKRSSDTRLRREVVAQMLDYAANAVVNWSIEGIRAEFETTSEKAGRDSNEFLQEFLGAEADPEVFWERVKTNLQAGKIKLIFVADSIPKELRRVIDFLSKQMDPAKVIGIEVKQFVGGGITSLVPEIIGQTAETQLRKSHSLVREVWDETKFFNVFKKRDDKKDEEVARVLYDWAIKKGLRIWWGHGTENGGYYPMLDVGEESFNTFGVTTGWKTGNLVIPFANYKHPFDSIEAKKDFAKEISDATGETLPIEKLDRYPSIKLAKLNESNLKKLFDSFSSYIDQIQSS